MSDNQETPSQLLEQILQTSVALRNFLRANDAGKAGTDGGGHPGALRISFRNINVRDMRELFDRVAALNAALNPSGSDSRAELADGISEYRQLLRQFRSVLPQIRGWLLAERARLAGRQVHAKSFECWARTNQQTR